MVVGGLVRWTWCQGQSRGIDEEQVLVAVVVVIEEGDAAAHGFGQQLFAIGAVVVNEGDASFLGDVREFRQRGFHRGTEQTCETEQGQQREPSPPAAGLRLLARGGDGMCP